ncbi:GNAT family N-acetyltransferase [Entomohabitans teleogrylli]|uniref:GNAT family N-acetyltransferase n=1 Tax=Entomohabitans teleogrylli TaxID=1384589 RepID=UPI00073D6474|nr:GNAT family N-acetyltransferase [Entomohabitans teleogrylli]
MKIAQLNSATLPVYYRDIATLLVEADTSLSSVETQVYRLRSALEQNSALIWIARDEVGIAGMAYLSLSQDSDGMNRAQLKALRVLRHKRGQGTGKLLLNTLEAAARMQQRGLVYLNMPTGSPGEKFLRASGYRCLGGLPDYLCSGAGTCRASIIYYKRLSTFPGVR